MLAVVQRIDRLPEPRVAIGSQFTVAREADERLLLPHRIIALDVIEHLGLQHKEPAVNLRRAVVGLFADVADRVIAGRQCKRTEASEWLHSGERSMAPLRMMVSDERANVNVAHAIVVRQAERFLANVLTYSLETSRRHGIEPGIHQCNAPWLHPIVVDGGGAISKVVRKIGLYGGVLGKVALNHVAFVSTTSECATEWDGRQRAPWASGERRFLRRSECRIRLQK